MRIIAFNGFLFSQRQTGVMRYAREILKRLDNLAEATDMELVVPIYAINIPELKKIKIVKYGNVKGNLWEQLCLAHYVNKCNRICVNFNNSMPIFSKGIIVVHDIAYKVHPEYGTSLHGKMSNLYHRFIFWLVSKQETPILTDTYFSKTQLIDVYHINPKRITVIGCGWEHLIEIEEQPSILGKYELEKGKYYFTLGSVSKMKNTEWVCKAAQNNPKDIFVITGGKANADKTKYKSAKNLIFTGYISDGEIKTLLKNCKAFLYPSLYEGFGIPPLEALSQGAKVLCAYSACLPEIYGNSVHYIDPYNYNINFEMILQEPLFVNSRILEKYSWDNSAKLFWEFLKKVEI